MNNRINLNFDWKYQENFDESILKKECDESLLEQVNIPHANKEIPYNNFDEGMYQFVSGYRKHFALDESLKGKRFVLEFEGAASYAEVYVNGEFAFSHKGAYTSFRGDITSLLEVGKDNVISVKLDSTERGEIPPFGNVIDYLVYGGIYREVYLYVYDDVYMTNVLAASYDTLTDDAKLDIKVNFNKATDGVISFKLRDFSDNVVKEFKYSLDGTDKFLLKEEVGKVDLWDIERPVLYTLETTYNDQTISTKIGFREAVFKKDGFYLNGKLLKIRGLNRHQSYPYVGYAMPKSAQVADADFLKYTLGVNLVRTSHYPNSHHFLDRCDEIGLLVFTEIPGWQHINKGKEWRDLALNNVREMIIEDYNHASIVLWGVRINESGDDDELYIKTNELAHELDEYRQTGGVRCIPRSHLLEDVYTYNDFIHSGGKTALLPKFVVCGNVPYLVTEHNGHMFPTKTFDNEKKRQEHALRHAKVLDKMYKTKGVSGTIGWCMSDYNTHKDFGSGDKICYHGVSDMFRIEKLAAYVYMAQQDAKPILEITSNMEIGDNNGGMVGNVYMLTNCDEVKMYKNGVHINTFDIKAEKKKSEFKGLPHPPILLYDVIGNQIENNTDIKGKNAEKLKIALLGIKKYGVVGGIFHHPFKILGSMIKYKLSVDDITTMFGTYVTNWGGKQVTYTFEGYRDGKLVCTNEKGSTNGVYISVKADSSKLVEKDTYDVTRVVIKATSQYGNVLPYSNDAVTLESKGVEIIGPKTISLIGGQRGVWVKTIGYQGKASLTVKSDYGEETIEFDVKKILPNA